MSNLGVTVFAGLLVGVGGVISLASIAPWATVRDRIRAMVDRDTFGRSSQMAGEAQKLAQTTIKRYVLELQDLERVVKLNQSNLKARIDANVPVPTNEPKEGDYASALALLGSSIQSAKEAQLYAEKMYRSRKERIIQVVKTESDPARQRMLEYEETALLVQDLRNLRTGLSKILERVILTLTDLKIPFPARTDELYETIGGLGLTEGSSSDRVERPTTFDEAAVSLQTFRDKIKTASAEVNGRLLQFKQIYDLMTKTDFAKTVSFLPLTGNLAMNVME